MLAQKIYVGNLPGETTKDELETLFAAYGEVLSVALHTDGKSGSAQGFGVVEMSANEAAQAIAGVNGKDFGGCALSVNETRPRENHRAGRSYGGGGLGSSFNGGGGGYGGGGLGIYDGPSLA